MDQAPDVLRTLAERFDASAFDSPSGRATLRLRVTGEGDWDATVDATARWSSPPPTAHGRMPAWPPTPRRGTGSRTTSAAGWRRSAAAG